MKSRLLGFGLVGTILAALCCFTPLLPIMLTALGLTGVLAVVYTDAILLPLLAGFVALTIYAVVRKPRV